MAKEILTEEISQLGRELRLHVSSPASFTHYIAFNIFKPIICYGARGSYIEQTLTKRFSPGRERGKERLLKETSNSVMIFRDLSLVIVDIFLR